MSDCGFDDHYFDRYERILYVVKDKQLFIFDFPPLKYTRISDVENMLIEEKIIPPKEIQKIEVKLNAIVFQGESNG
jgi:hypothetical protein